jgi:hypothetical protein
LHDIEGEAEEQPRMTVRKRAEKRTRLAFTTPVVAPNDIAFSGERSESAATRG